MILRPGTGTNPIYARKHGHEIPNALDKVLAGLCSDYEPTGARNSVDALEMLCKGERVTFSNVSAEPPSTRVAARTYPTAHSNEVFGKGQTPPLTRQPVTTPARPVVPVALPDLEGILSANHGWSAQDSRRQLQALKHCPGDSVDAVISSAFNQSVELEANSSTTGSWSAGLATLSLVTGLGAVAAAFSNLSLAAGLACGALATTGGSVLLSQRSKLDYNNGEILSDLGHRIANKTRGFDYDRHGDHGSYTDDFQPNRQRLPEKATG